MLFQSGREARVVTAVRRRSVPAPAREPAGAVLASWAEQSGHRRAAEPCRDGLRFAFYGRVSTEDYQDPLTSRARQLGQAAALVAGSRRIVAEFFDAGQSRVLPWARRPQAAALVAAMADPGRGFDAIVIGEYERAFYGSQYALMAPLFEHYGIQLWLPEAPAYRCRHGYSSASAPDPAWPKNLYIREDRILPHLPALCGPAAARRDTGRTASAWVPATMGCVTL